MKTCPFGEAKYAMLESPFTAEAYAVIAKSQSRSSCISCVVATMQCSVYNTPNKQHVSHQVACFQATKATELLH